MALLHIILMFCTVFQNRHREGHAQTIPLCFPSRSTGARIAAPDLGMALKRHCRSIRACCEPPRATRSELWPQRYFMVRPSFSALVIFPLQDRSDLAYLRPVP